MNNLYFRIPLFFVLLSFTLTSCTKTEKPAENDTEEWVSLWDGQSFEGWKASENPDSFSIEDGKIVVNGPRGHLFYEGSVANANFDDFEFKAEVYTFPNSNSGIFFHTQYQEEGWPQHGYEAQVNATYSNDPRRTGSLYGVNDVMNDAPHEDENWFEYHIIVKDKDITFKIDGETVMEFTEPKDREGTIKLSSGTFALQAHDPDSKVYFRNIRVKPIH